MVTNMSPTINNETYFRKYLDDPVIITPQVVQKETAQSNVALHAGLDAEQAQFHEQLNQQLRRVF